ncbi:MAG: sigma-54-dependent Fis family transcriptional regulator [Chloroflexi bacterium]|nr:sigma-54-dependent Fis family transcriptional regulator [Chloroflexota bacterium]
MTAATKHTAEAAEQESSAAAATLASSGGKRILIADDDTHIRSLLVTVLQEEGYETLEAKSGGEVLRAVAREEPDLLILDLRMPEWSGIEIMRRLNEQGIKTPVLLMTAFGTSTSTIEAMQLGAYDYITKPFELDDVKRTVERYFEYERLSSEVRKLRGQLEGRDLSERIIGNSPKMQRIYKEIGRVAQSDASVLIMGETGTGKELIAEALHVHSSYRGGPLVKVNLTALPETLVESELFGHEKGSFTGAITQHKGRFEMAHKGTIFLDEIGDMSLNTQRKLLRVLQDKQFERVGGSVSVKVDCRVIAATNKDLAAEVKTGRFREDLFYRLAVITIHTPSLRERKEDIPLLVEHFLQKHRYTPSSPPARISEEAMQLLLDYEWPGNVRELEHAIERATILARGEIITSQHINLTPAQPLSIIDLNEKLKEHQPLAEVIAEVESRLINLALEQEDHNLHHAAKLLGLDLGGLEKKMAQHGMSV